MTAHIINSSDHRWLSQDDVSDCIANVKYWLDATPTVGGDTFTADAVATVPVTVKGFSAAQTGDLLDVFQTGTTVAFSVKTVASAVNGLTLTAESTGVSPILAAVGETNVGVSIKPKGTGTVVFTAGAVAGVPVEIDGAGTTQTGSLLAVKQNSAGNTLFEVATVTTAATGLKLTSAAASAGVALVATSSAVAENLTLDSKGTGTLTLNGTATGSVRIGADLTLVDAKNIVLDTTTGTKIGTSTTQKIGFFNSTPIVQPSITGALSTVADAPAKAVLTSIIAALKASGLGLAADTTT